MALYNVAVVGATGAVGREFVNLLEERKFPLAKLYLFASERSLGQSIEFNGRDLDVTPLTEENIKSLDIDFAFFSAGAIVATKFAPLFAEKGAVVIDNSSAFRMDDKIPLVVPEVNGELIEFAKKGTIIANPNCSTIQMVPFLQIVEELYGIESVVVSTYQSVSGAGQKGIDELREQVQRLFNAQGVTPSVFPQRIAFNLIPQIGSFYPDGYTQEEKKMIYESRKILDLPELDIEVTTVRVPIFYAHAETVLVTLKHDADLGILRDEINEKLHLKLMDDIELIEYPTPADAGGENEIFIGRLRYGGDGRNKKRLHAWIVADNLKKGAALNGIQIAEKIAGGRYDS